MRQPSADTLATAADHAACRRAIKTGSKSFYAASLLLPRRVRAPSYALYAFCRLSDDAVDLDAARLDRAGRREVVDRLIARLDGAYAGVPADSAADRAFAQVVSDCAMPRALPAALLEGLAWDADGRRCATLSDLYAYGARVAGAVGAMMTVVMGPRDRETLARATDLGVAMQLTNIARDVGEDARAGRVYLPTDWLAEEGVDLDQFLSDPKPEPEIRRVTERLLAAADVLYARSESGVGRLPRACRPAIWAARLLYAEIGREVARAGFDSVTRRAVVSSSRKVELLSRAVGAAVGGAAAATAGASAPALAETAFLVDAVAAAPHPAIEPERGILGRIDHRLGRVIDLFQRLDELEQSR